MDNLTIIIALLSMSATIIFCRTLPLMLPRRWLNSRWIYRLNQQLPLCIMIVLLLSSLSLKGDISASILTIVSELITITAVILSYHWKRNILLSVAVGIIILNLLSVLHQ